MKRRIATLLILFAFLIPMFAGAVPVKAAPTELFFSEYGEGSSYNKVLEIYNGTGAAIDLAAGYYSIEIYFNGSVSAGTTIDLTGTIADGDVYVVADDGATAAEILAETDQTSSSSFFNGDDAVALLKNGTIIDVIGQIGSDPGSYWGSGDVATQDHTLRRKATIEAGDTDGADAFDPAAEWDGYPQDTFDGLGSHTIGALDYTPIYDIQYTTDPSGDSPLSGQSDITTEGIVTAIFSSGYFIEDPAGGAWNGIYVYDSNVPVRGDRLRLTGTISEYYNLTQLSSLTGYEVISNSNALPNPVVGTTLAANDEQYEGVLVRVENVTVTNGDLGYGEWSVSDGSGDVIIDDKGSYTYSPTTSESLFAVIGPLDYAYGTFRIQPRDDYDILLDLDYTPIYDIQYTTDPFGDSPFSGQSDITTEGIVTAVFYNGYFIEDPAGGAWNGLWVFDSNSPALGDRVRLTGTVSEYYNLTQLDNLTIFEVVSSSNDLPDAVVLATGDVSQEQWEDVLVRVENVTVTNGDLGYGEWSVSDGSGDVILDDKGSYNYAPTTGDALVGVIGPLDYSFSAFKIQPRDDNDILLTPPPPVMVINEFLADPAGDLTGDANGDGIRDSSDDEFVEIVNNSDSDMDISGWTLSDGYGVRHTFPSGTVVFANCNIVVFGGGTPTGAFGGAVVQTANGAYSQLGLNNTGDTITLNDGLSDQATYTYGSEGGDNQSLTRDPDISGETFVKHTVATSSGGTLFSPGTMIDGASFSGCIIELGVCGDPTTLIHEVQGDSSTSPLNGVAGIILEGVVVGDFQDTATQLSGFFLQEEDADADGDPLSSEGIFVLDNGVMDVSVGETVRVMGTVNEYFGLTELKSIRATLVCNSGSSVTPATASMPVSSLDVWERYEGMLVTIPQTLYASDNYDLGRYGEVTLSVDGRLNNPTNVVDPGEDAIALQDLNDRSQIQMDDGSNVQNPLPLPPYLSADNTLRAGDTLPSLTGALGYAFGVYEIHPIEEVNFTRVNERPAISDPVGGVLKVASFNVLNYFTTIDNGVWSCGPSEDMECRGADTADEFTQQRTKIIAAITNMDADVVGLMEIENHVADAALQDLVNGLNDVAGAETYAYLGTGPVGTDAIKVAFIYKPDTASPLGDYAILDSSVVPDFDDTKNRPVVAQTFQHPTGEVLTVAVNHLKSKGSSCASIGDPDIGDGQGNCNLTRTAAAEALVDWLETDPTGSGDSDILIIGDLNSYAKEDPIDVLKDGGYTNLIESFIGPYAYSYVYFGQSGYLDHALASDSLLSRVMGTSVWHINADEPSALDFNEYNQPELYNPDQYRSSDHDPVIVGICDSISPEVEVTLNRDTLWPANHKYVTVKAHLDVFDASGDTTIELLSVTSNESDNGEDDGNTVNDIVILNDSTFKLRAERSGSGTGRVYTITYAVTDPCGNMTIVTATVTVPLSQGK